MIDTSPKFRNIRTNTAEFYEIHSTRKICCNNVENAQYVINNRII